MKNAWRVFCLGLCFVSLLTLAQAADTTTKKPAELAVQVQVKGPSGIDLKSVSLVLYGMSRPLMTLEKTIPVDAKGQATVTLVDATFDTVGGTDEAPVPCQGLFHLVAIATGTAGAVSPILYLDTEKPSLDDATNEWGPAFQKPVDLRELATKKEPLVLTLVAGKTLKGKVLTIDEKPVGNATVRMQQDLHGDSHTGKGREIFGQEAKTDAQGNFSFAQVFPNTIYVSEVVPAETDKQAIWFWKATRINGKKYGYPENSLPLASQTADLDFVLLVDSERYHYTGVVQGKDGKPIAEAGLNLSVAFHPDGRDFTDSHTFVDTKTDAQGRFSIESEAPFANSLSITKEGYEDLSVEGDPAVASGPLTVGTHTYTLEKQQK